MIVSDESEVPPGSIVSTPVNPMPPQPYEESKTLLANKHGSSMLKSPHVDTLSALSNPIYSADDSSNIYQTISNAGENDYEDLDENFNGRNNCAPYEVPIEAGAGVKGKASLRRKGVVDAEDATYAVIENQNAVDSDVESEQEKYNRTSHSQAIAKVCMNNY